jgi:hypothetical protein
MYYLLMKSFRQIVCWLSEFVPALIWYLSYKSLVKGCFRYSLYLFMSLNCFNLTSVNNYLPNYFNWSSLISYVLHIIYLSIYNYWSCVNIFLSFISTYCSVDIRGCDLISDTYFSCNSSFSSLIICKISSFSSDYWSSIDTISYPWIISKIYSNIFLKWYVSMILCCPWNYCNL